MHHRSSRLVFVAGFGLIASLLTAAPAAGETAATVPVDRTPFPTSLAAGLPADQLARPYLQYRFSGVDQSEAEVLLAEAAAAIYLADWGEVWVLTSPDLRGTTAGWARLADGPRAAQPPWELAEGGEETTVGTFLAEIAQRLPGLDTGALGRYVLKCPSVRLGPQAALSAQTSPPRGAAAGTVTSEGFETDPWSRWDRYDNTGGQYRWEVTSCEAHTGTRSADAVRGGTLGALLACASPYPNNAQMWLETGTCEDFTGAQQAWLDLYADLNCESGYDVLGFYFQGADEKYYGVLFTGNFGGWFRIIGNLRQWYALGDLSLQPCNTFAIVFESDVTDAPGFGARVDDINIVTDSAPGPTCSAMSSPASGPAPLTVTLTGSSSGFSAAATPSWSFGDGTSASSAQASHTYAAPGEFDARFRMLEGSSRCYAWTHVSVTTPGGGGVNPSPGTYVGTTSQGRPMEFDVDAAGRLTRWKVDFACGTASGYATTTPSVGCAVTNGTFSCGAATCSTYGVGVKLMGTFSNATTAAGTLDMAVGIGSSSSCCTLNGLGWSASLSAGAPLAVTATGTPTSGSAPLTVSFTGGASGGTPPYSYSWNFGDGSAASTSQNPTHTYQTAGSFTATLTVTDAVAATATASTALSVSAPSQVFRALIPAVAHNPGAGQTLWRTDVAAANLTASAAQLTLTFHAGASAIVRSDTLAPGATREWANIVETLFGVSPSSSTQGVVEVTANQRLAITARTFNQTSAGTFGQYLPALEDHDALQSSERGILAQLRKSSAYRTNLGAINLGSSSCTVRVDLHDATGAAVGDTRRITLAPGEWKQENDIFELAHAGTQEVAYAEIIVETPGGRAWVYGSVVDAVTGDPTTVPVIVPLTEAAASIASSGRTSVPSATSDQVVPDIVQTSPPDVPPLILRPLAEPRMALANAYAGYWYGTTGQNLPINIHVSDAGQVDYLTLRLRMSFVTFTCTANASPSGPFPLSGTSLDTTVTFPGSNITSHVQGSFTSTSAASGTYSGYSGSFAIVCGSYLSFGTGSPLGSGTWTAGRETATPLSASATADVTSGNSPFVVHFTGSASGGTPPYTYAWSFGDGTTSYLQSPTHTYSKAGALKATFYAWDSHNWGATSSIDITVIAPPLTTSASGTPTSGQAPLAVQFTASPSGGVAPYTYSWDFGDGTAKSTSQNPTHTYATAGDFTATLTAKDAASQSATATVAVHVDPPPSVSATASASVTSGQAPLTVQFTGGASGGTPPYSYSWDFGDGTSGSSSQNPSHTYQNIGSFTATLTVTDAAAATAAATVTVTATAPPPAFTMMVPAVAHNPGTPPTVWRTDLAVVNPGTMTASLTLTFISGATTITRTDTLAPGAAVDWVNVLETVFGIAPSASVSGCVTVGSSVPVVATARTYNATAQGTFGQYLPALAGNAALPQGAIGVLPQLKKSEIFRTNIGAINLGGQTATVTVTLHGATGATIGSPRTISLAPGEWKQENDVFNTTGAGLQAIAYGTVQVQPASASAWVYASVVDGQTGDPTTIPVLVP